MTLNDQYNFYLFKHDENSINLKSHQTVKYSVITHNSKSLVAEKIDMTRTSDSNMPTDIDITGR
jgi:hypothetical protein